MEAVGEGAACHAGCAACSVEGGESWAKVGVGSVRGGSEVGCIILRCAADGNFARGFQPGGGGDVSSPPLPRYAALLCCCFCTTLLAKSSSTKRQGQFRARFGLKLKSQTLCRRLTGEVGILLLNHALYNNFQLQTP